MIDIVIVNYNSTDFLIKCLNSVIKDLGDINAVIYVQDNGSTDNVDRIKSFFPGVNLTKNKRNLGFGKAVNQALAKCKNEYVILINPDAYVTKGFFASSLKFMDKYQDVGIMGPKILDSDGMLQNSARSFPTLLTAFFGRSSFLSKKFPKNPITSKNLLSLKSDGKTPMEVDWVSGACMVVRRKAIMDVGYLDERFFMYWEDTDWCTRMWEKGWRVVYCPKVIIYHYVGGSSGKKAAKSIIEFHKSVYRLFDKYLAPSLAFLRPLVICGLSIRMSLLLFSHYAGVFLNISETKDLKEEDKIKILRIISRMNVGGPAIHVYLLTKGLDKEKFESILVTGCISPNEGDMGYLFGPDDPKPVFIPDLQREIRLDMDIKALIKIFKILVHEKPDIVHTHTAKAGFSARFAVLFHNMIWKKQVLMVHTFHGHVFEGYFSPLTSMIFVNIERYLAKISDAIIAISHTQKQELTRKYKIATPEKIKTIKLGFDLAPFLNAKKRKGALRRRIKAGKDTVLIGIIGRLVPIKNHKMFLKAAKLFMNTMGKKDVRFVIVGDGELRADLEKECKISGLSEITVFCGWVHDIPTIYADLDILALTSLNEGTPVSIIESMAASVPVISTDAGGVKDLLGDGTWLKDNGFCICRRGILCGKNNPFAFSAGLKYLVCEDKEKQKQRVESARKFVEKEFGKTRLLRDMESLYTYIIKKRRKKRIWAG